MSRSQYSATEVNERTPLIVTNNSVSLRGTIESWSSYEKITAVACILLLIIGVSIGTYLLITEDNNWDPSDFEIMLRNDWNASKFNSTPKKQTLPVLRVLLLETDSSCNNSNNCKDSVKSIQQKHLQKNEEDIKYNFLVGGDGKIYEGRGWKYASPLASSDQQAVIAFLGQFDSDGPTNQQVDALKAFLNYSVAKYYLTDCYEVIVRYSPRRYLIDVAQKLSESIKKDENIKCYF